MSEQIIQQESNLLEEAVVLVVHGVCKPNPGPGVVGFIIYDRTGKEIMHRCKRIGKTTNHQAEYHALILGLEYASKYTKQRVVCVLNNLSVVRQVNQKNKVRKKYLIDLYEGLKEKEGLLKEVTYGYLSLEDPRMIKVGALVKEAQDI